MFRRYRKVHLLIAALVTVALASACGSGGGSGSGSGSGQKALTVIEVNQAWPSLGPPPAKQSAIFTVNYMNAIYGQLFKRGEDGKVQPGLASAWSTSSDGKTITITVRDGVKFQDGTPFNAEAVKEQFDRSVDPKNACQCLGSFTAVESTSVDGNKVLLHLSRPDATIIQSFISQQPNWIPSPTALKQMGDEAFGQKPVGAGPFSVVSNVASSKLVLKKNPDYYETGKPLLDSLTFQSAASDQTAYAALQSKSVQMVMGVTTASILTQAKSQFQQSSVPGVVAYQVLFNSKNPKSPFANPLARQAVAFATDPNQVLASTSPGYGVLSQSPSGPSGLFHQPTVSGTRSHDVAKAKQLSQQLGGLSFHMYYPNNSPIFINGAQALARQWADAGLNVTLDPVTPTESAQKNATGNWDAQFTNAGGVDPDIGLSGLPNRYGSKGGITCCKDTTLDGMIAKSQSTTDDSQRGQLFNQIYEYINNQQYSVNLFSVPTVALAAKNLTGITASPNQSSGKEMVPWESVSFS